MLRSISANAGRLANSARVLPRLQQLQRRSFLTQENMSTASGPDLRLHISLAMYGEFLLRFSELEKVGEAHHTAQACVENLLRAMAALPSIHVSGTPETLTSLPNPYAKAGKDSTFAIALYQSLPADQDAFFEWIHSTAKPNADDEVDTQDMENFRARMTPTTEITGPWFLYNVYVAAQAGNDDSQQEGEGQAAGTAAKLAVVMLTAGGKVENIVLTKHALQMSLMGSLLEQYIEAEKCALKNLPHPNSPFAPQDSSERTIDSLRRSKVLEGKDLEIQQSGVGGGQTQRRVYRPVFTSPAAKWFFCVMQGNDPDAPLATAVNFADVAGSALAADSAVDGGIVVNPVGDLNHEMFFRAATVITVDELRAMGLSTA